MSNLQDLYREMDNKVKNMNELKTEFSELMFFVDYPEIDTVHFYCEYEYNDQGGTYPVFRINTVEIHDEQRRAQFLNRMGYPDTDMEEWLEEEGSYEFGYILGRYIESHADEYGEGSLHNDRETLGERCLSLAQRMSEAIGSSNIPIVYIVEEVIVNYDDSYYRLAEGHQADSVFLDKKAAEKKAEQCALYILKEYGDDIEYIEDHITWPSDYMYLGADKLVQDILDGTLGIDRVGYSSLAKVREIKIEG
jgi:hypothetical protein